MRKFWIVSFLSLLSAANEPLSYRAVSSWEEVKLAIRGSSKKLGLLEKLNRADRENLKRLDVWILPSGFDLDEKAYSPLPETLPSIAHFRTFLLVHLPFQVFGAYENGTLVRWGPVSSGRRSAPTPPGFYSLNWRARERVSTINSDWVLSWVYNFDNLEGLSLHAYSLPGEPASQACIRLLERDAEWLYYWGEPWKLCTGRVVRRGTAVLILRDYDFSSPPPWQSPENLQSPLELPSDDISALGR